MNTQTKLISVFLGLTVLLSSCAEKVNLSNGESVLLKENWTLTREGFNESYKATVPSTVAGVLYDNGYFGDDLFVGENYYNQDKTIFDDAWWYKTSINTAVQSGSHCFLEFEGLNFYSDIYFNGTQIASKDTTIGVFIHREYDVTALMAAKNDLSVRLERAKWGDLNIGFVDWAPRPLDESMGIWRNVSLRCVGDVKVDDLFIIPDLDTETLAQADLEVRFVLTNLADEAKDVVARISYEDVSFTYPVTLAAGEKKEVRLTPAECPELHVDNPRVWWCNGFAQSTAPAQMYSLQLDCEDASGVLSDSQSASFGIRKIETYLDKDNRRGFRLNGQNVLIKGAGWADDLLLRDTHESIENQISYVRDMNMNCVRFENIWGKDQAVYDMCDKYGLLALVGWSCQWEWENYCGLPETGFGCIATPEEIELVTNYFIDQVKWLRNHPSVFAWMVGSDCLPDPVLEQNYMKIYPELDYRPYIGSAKELTSDLTGPSGTKMAGPYDYVSPEYWYVDTKLGGAFGFNTETGIGVNLPVEESIRKMVPADSLWPLSVSWNKHCTTSGSSMSTMNGIVKPIENSYHGAYNLKDFIRKAQALDYDATRAMFESFRVNVPVSTGIVQWMLNSAWPSMYWQLYDYYQVPTASYYGVKAGNQPVQAIYNYKDRNVYVSNETGAAFEGSVRVRVFDDQSNVLADKTIEVECEHYKPVKVFDASFKQDVMLALDVIDSDGEVIADNFYCVPVKGNIHDWTDDSWFKTDIEQYADMGFVCRLPRADVSMSSRLDAGEENVITVRLTNNSSYISFQNVLKVTDAQGNIIVPSIWSNNYISVLPGETRILTCRIPAGLLPSDYIIKREAWNDSSDPFPTSLSSPQIVETGLRDFSGIAGNSEGGFYFIDNGGYLCKADMYGNITEKNQLTPLQGDYVDAEAVCCDMKSGEVYIADEVTSDVLKWKGGGEVEKVANFDFPGRKHNLGLEALEIVEDTLYVGNQAEPARIFKYALKTGEVKSFDIPFVKSLSDFHFEPQTGTFWIADSFNHKILICDRDFNVFRTFDVPFISKTEGLWVDWSTKEVWTACDATGRLYKMKMDQREYSSIDSLTRARSRYAVNSFSDGDQYTAVNQYETVKVSQPKGRKVKNVIFMIGDGMGLEQVSCAWVANGGKLNIDNFEYVGIQRTYAENALVTDSPAAGSALATGKKTPYGHISTDSEGNARESLLEFAQKKGKKTGLAVTCRINDATPAGFCTHVTSRELQEEIVSQMAESGVDFLTGGGLRYWTSRSDGRNVVNEMQQKGYCFVDTNDQLKQASTLPLLGLFADLEMDPSLERGDVLEQSAIKAMDLLDNKKGFFLMVEGSSIDDWCHRNKVGEAMEELYDFDRTIGHVLKWAENDGKTLVVVTGDHNTGGLSLLDGDIARGEIKVNFSTSGHNGVALPVYAYGPHAEDFVGIYENSELSDKIKKYIK